METGGRQDEERDREADEAGKVVRIPRDWFGPAEDLVPFGPRASVPAEELDPNSFWDESSNDIQHVVEAPAERQDDLWFGGGVPDRLARLPRTVGRRTLAAAVLVALTVAGSVVGLLLGNPQRRLGPPAIASVNAVRSQRSTRSLGRLTATIRTYRGLQNQRKPRVHHRAARTPSSTATPVVYRSSQTNLPQPTNETAGSGVGAASEGSGGRSVAVTTTSSSHAASQTSQPAFGATGALGPMSSPAG